MWTDPNATLWTNTMEVREQVLHLFANYYYIYIQHFLCVGDKWYELDTLHQSTSMPRTPVSCTAESLNSPHDLQIIFRMGHTSINSETTGTYCTES